MKTTLCCDDQYLVSIQHCCVVATSFVHTADIWGLKIYGCMTLVIALRVESGSDDPDNVGHLGHFFDGSSGSHPRTKLSGCDPDFLVH